MGNKHRAAPNAWEVGLGLACLGLAAGVVLWAQWPLLAGWFGTDARTLSPSMRLAAVAPQFWFGGSGPNDSAAAAAADPGASPLVLLSLMAGLFGWMVAVGGWALIARGVLVAAARAAGVRIPLNSVEMAAAGLVALGLVTFLLGWLVAPLMGMGILWLGPVVGIMAWIAQRPLEPRRPARAKWVPLPNLGFAQASALLLSILLAGLMLIASLVPPIQSDAMRYHLGAPQEWLRLGRIEPLPLNAFSAFPFLPGMHFLLLLAWDGPENPGPGKLAAVVHLIGWLLSVGALMVLLVRQTPFTLRRSGMAIAILVGFTVPAGMVLATWPFIDHFVLLFVVLAAGSLGRWLRTNHQATARIEAAKTGVWLGALLSTKYTALPMLMALAMAGAIVLILADGGTRRALMGRLRTGAAGFAILLVVAGSPWYVRNLIHYGNPLYPALAGRMGSGDWTPQSAALYAAKLAEKGDSFAVAGVAGPITALWNSTFSWVRFEGHFLGSNGLLVLTAAIAALATSLIGRGWSAVSGRRSLRLLIPLWGAGIYGAWALSYQSNRMLLPVLFLLLPSVAMLLARMASRAAWLRWTVFGVVWLVATHSSLWAVQWLYVTQPHPPDAGAVVGTHPTPYLNRALNYHQAYDYLAKRKAAGRSDFVLHHGEHRIFHARHRAVWADWFDTPALLSVIRADRCRTVADLREALVRRGVTHVLVNDAELAPQAAQYFRPRFTPEEWVLAESFLSTLSLEWGEAGRVRILSMDHQPATGSELPGENGP